MKPPFILVQKIISHNTVEAARTVMEDAQHGNAIGMAATVMYLYPEPHFVTITTDEADRNPIFTSGMLASLNYQLMRKANE